MKTLFKTLAVTITLISIGSGLAPQANAAATIYPEGIVIDVVEDSTAQGQMTVELARVTGTDLFTVVRAVPVKGAKRIPDVVHLPIEKTGVDKYVGQWVYDFATNSRNYIEFVKLSTGYYVISAKYPI